MVALVKSVESLNRKKKKKKKMLTSQKKERILPELTCLELEHQSFPDCRLILKHLLFLEGLSLLLAFLVSELPLALSVLRPLDAV